MTALSEELILAALAFVEDPSQGQDIVALGMVSGLKIKDSNISFALSVPAHRGPAMEPVRRAAEKAALAIEGVTSATVVVTAHSGRNASLGNNELETQVDGGAVGRESPRK